MKKIKIIVLIIITLTIVLLGVIKINIINTKAFSEKNSSIQGINVNSIKDDFGKEFSEFITDKAIIKIHQTDEEKYILEINGQEYKFTGNLGLLDTIKKDTDYLYEFIKNALNKNN